MYEYKEPLVVQILLNDTLLIISPVVLRIEAL